jgi:hypothetical protein
MFNSIQLRRISLVAFIAILMTIVAPTISKAMTGAQNGNKPIEVCTSEGSRQVVISIIEPDHLVGYSSDPISPNHDDGHCLYCSLQYATFLPVTTNSFPTIGALRISSASLYQTPILFSPRDRKRSRAPPTFL